jgi:hypothetical protein
VWVREEESAVKDAHNQSGATNLPLLILRENCRLFGLEIYE